jgi:multidrug resistance efflux pump
VKAGAELFVINNDRLDTSNIDHVRSQLEQTMAEIEGLNLQVKGYNDLRRSLQERLQSHLDSNESYLTLKAAEASGMLRKAEETRDQAARDYARQKGLAGKGVDSAQAYESAQTKQKEATNEVIALEAVLNRTKSELEASRKGVLLDGYSGAPYAQQRLDELSLRLAEAEASLARGAKRKQALERQLAHEEETVRKLSDATILAPSLSLVQSVRVAKGSDVMKGTVLCELVDCSKSYIEATVPEKLFDRVRIGQEAKVFLYGNSNPIPGRVISVRGAGANNTSNPTMFAAKVNKTTPDSMIVNVGISADDLIRVFGSANQVGRTARVSLVR